MEIVDPGEIVMDHHTHTSYEYVSGDTERGEVKIKEDNVSGDREENKTEQCR